MDQRETRTRRQEDTISFLVLFSAVVKRRQLILFSLLVARISKLLFSIYPLKMATTSPSGLMPKQNPTEPKARLLESRNDSQASVPHTSALVVLAEFSGDSIEAAKLDEIKGKF